jgi:hypothetical protein|tara:strand:- start:72 stop:260 length:189 start_codon:yes stop_codon:yes gene_type:complete
MDLFTKKLTERVQQDYDSAKLRMKCFESGTTEYAFNQATMLQASTTLFDIKDIPKHIRYDKV